MARIVKDPEERKTEIMDAALALFGSKGFEQTSVNEIIEKVGVAKGTFLLLLCFQGRDSKRSGREEHGTASRSHGAGC